MIEGEKAEKEAHREISAYYNFRKFRSRNIILSEALP